MVYAYGSEPYLERVGGSTPLSGTKFRQAGRLISEASVRKNVRVRIPLGAPICGKIDKLGLVAEWYTRTLEVRISQEVEVQVLSSPPWTRSSVG